MTRGVAFITGASRGIGRVCAVDLAEAGFDVAITARTVHPGEKREHSSTLRESDLPPLPGSLSEVAARIKETGSRCLMVPAALLDRASLAGAAERVLRDWGRVDVGMGYGVSKGAFQRVAGFIAVELGPSGIRCFNVQPGPIATVRIGQDMAKHGIPNNGEPAEIVAKVVTWLATDPGAGQLNGGTVEAPYFCHEHGLLEGWDGPRPLDHPIRYDRSGAILAELEAANRAVRATGTPSRLPTGGSK